MSGVPLAERVVEVIADLGGDRFEHGSGCRVAGQTVRTAAHVDAGAHNVTVRGADKLEHPGESYRLIGDPGEPGPDRAPDLALLTVPELPAVSPVPLAAVDRDSDISEPVQRCQAVGYPEFAERPG